MIAGRRWTIPGRRTLATNSGTESKLSQPLLAELSGPTNHYLSAGV